MKVNTVEADGLQWCVDGPDAHLAYRGHEKNFRDLLLTWMPDGGVFLDVGAHGGGYAVRLAAKAECVFAVEPHPENRALLYRNLRANKTCNVVVVPYAASAFKHNAYMTSAGGSSRITDEGLEVQARTLDALHLKRLDLVKIDVEGHEVEVIKGLWLTLQTCKPIVFLELHDGLYGDGIRRDTKRVLECYGYSMTHIGDYGAGHYYLCQAVGKPARGQGDIKSPT